MVSLITISVLIGILPSLTTAHSLLISSLARPLLPPHAALLATNLPSSTALHALYALYASTTPFTDQQTTTLVQFDFVTNDGVLVWTLPTLLDDQVVTLQMRRNEMGPSSAGQADTESQQRVFDGSERARGVVPQTLAEVDGSKLVYMPSIALLDEWTSSPSNAFTEIIFISSLPIVVSTTSVPSASLVSIEPPEVDAESIARINQHLATLRYSEKVDLVLKSMQRGYFGRVVRYLSGEDQSGAKDDSEKWESRHSMAQGGTRAAEWVLAELRSFGLECEKHYFLKGFAPMVSCEIRGSNETEGTFVLGAHFDSRGTFGFPSAPGADDDASGTALLLSIARLIATEGLKFKSKIIIAAFAGEEQGLLGSNWFAKKLKERGEDVKLMVQADMLGYRKPGEPRQIGFPDKIGLTEARWLLGNISTIYAPELVVGMTPACCSDHQSFVSQGYASTWVFERNGPIADPMYHNSGDLSARAGYDFEQIYLISRVVLASVLEIAGLE